MAIMDRSNDIRRRVLENRLKGEDASFYGSYQPEALNLEGMGGEPASTVPAYEGAQPPSIPAPPDESIYNLVDQIKDKPQAPEAPTDGGSDNWAKTQGDSLRDRGVDPSGLFFGLLAAAEAIANKGKSSNTVEFADRYKQGMQDQQTRKIQNAQLGEAEEEARGRARERQLQKEFRSGISSLDPNAPTYESEVRSLYGKYYPEKSAAALLSKTNSATPLTEQEAQLISFSDRFTGPEKAALIARAAFDPEGVRKLIYKTGKSFEETMAEAMMMTQGRADIQEGVVTRKEDRKKAADAQAAAGSLEAFIKASEASPAKGKLQGLGTNLAAIVGADPNAKIMMDMRGALAGTLAKAFGDSGRLSDFDIRRVQGMAPSVYDTPEERQIKVTLLKALVDKTLSAGQVSDMIETAFGGGVIIPEVTSQFEYENLAPGQKYRDSDGQIRMKGE